MKPSHDDLDKFIQSATEVPWPKTLQEQILRKAEGLTDGSLDDDLLLEPASRSSETDSKQQLGAPVREHRQRRVRPKRNRSWMVAFAGVAAALLVSVAVWNTGKPTGVPNQVPAPGEGSAPSVSTGPMHSANKVAASTNTVGLRAAPLSVQNLVLSSSRPGGPKDEVTATLTNTGSTPVSRLDLFGVLSFHKHSGGGSLLQSVAWITFVDAPHATIMPGQSVSWSFKPVTAPVDAKGNLIDVPTLQFYWAGTAQSQATDTWKLVPVQLTVNGVDVRQTWATGESFTVHTTVRNDTSQAINWNDCLAVIWFDPPVGGQPGALNPQTDANGQQTGANQAGTSQSAAYTTNSFGFTTPGVDRYFTKVSGPAGQGQELAPSARTQLSFELVGPVRPDLKAMQAHVLLIEQGGTK